MVSIESCILQSYNEVVKKPHDWNHCPTLRKIAETMDAKCRKCELELHDITPTHKKQTKQYQLHGEIVKDEGCK